VFGMHATAVKPPATAAAASGGDRFFMREAGFAEMNVHVDEARRHDRTGCIDHAGVARVGVLDELAYEAVVDDDVQHAVEA